MGGLIGSGAEMCRTCCSARTRPSAARCASGETLTSPRSARSAACGERIALVPADRQLLGLSRTLTLWENIVMLVEDEHYRGGVFHRGELVELAREAVQRFEIRPPQTHTVTATFSGGNQQKALLAKWLIAGPRLLLLHEPTQGVDVGARRDIYRFVKSAATLNQTSVLWVTTDFGELAEVCDRVIVLVGRPDDRHAGRCGAERRRNHRSRAAADEGGQMSASPGAPAPVETGGHHERPAERDRPSAIRRLGLQRYAIVIVLVAMIVAFGVDNTRRPSFRSATSPTSSVPRRCCSSS